MQAAAAGRHAAGRDVWRALLTVAAADAVVLSMARVPVRSRQACRCRAQLWAATVAHCTGPH